MQLEFVPLLLFLIPPKQLLEAPIQLVESPLQMVIALIVNKAKNHLRDLRSQLRQLIARATQLPTHVYSKPLALSFYVLQVVSQIIRNLLHSSQKFYISPSVDLLNLHYHLFLDFEHPIVKFLILLLLEVKQPQLL